MLVRFRCRCRKAGDNFAQDNERYPGKKAGEDDRIDGGDLLSDGPLISLLPVYEWRFIGGSR